MTNKPLLLAAMLLAACAAMTNPGGSPGGKGHPSQLQDPSLRRAGYCHLRNCEVTVTVDASCHVTVEPYALVMGGSAPPITVVWKLNGNASFPASGGIWFKDAAGRRVFVQRAAGPRSYVFQNSGEKGVYHYGVQVEQGGKPCPILDPIGVNDI